MPEENMALGQQNYPISETEGYRQDAKLEMKQLKIPVGKTS